MKRILIPTDFSENSWNAIKYGLALFQDSKNTFYLLHVNPIPAYSGAGSSVRAASRMMDEALLKSNKEDLDEIITKIKELPFNTEHTFISYSTHDYFIDCIKREVQDKTIDLIIMGTKGASGIKEITLGSNTGDVITRVKCPLLAVPENASIFNTLRNRFSNGLSYCL